MGSRILIILLAFQAMVTAVMAQNQIDWPVLSFTSVATLNTAVTDIANAGDGSGRLFIAEKSGVIRILQNGALLPTWFLLPRNLNAQGTEQGLLGIAFPPGFASKGYFYVSYTNSLLSANVVSRFHVSATNRNVADPNSEEIILSVPQPFANHNAGQIHFGPDGFLYISKGDGGSEGDPNNIAQTTNTLLGKMLRIDVENGTSPYAVPATNPFVGNPAYSPEIWAIGLRNPWRFSFDRQTGDLYIADVGENSWEEIDFQSAQSAGGQNYGWRIMEGFHPNDVPKGFDLSTLTLPVQEFSHAGAFNVAVIGGYVYRGPSSSRMDGVYFYGDFGTTRVFALKFDGTAWQSRLAGLSPGVSSTFGEDELGRVYVASYPGTIYLLSDTNSADAPAFNPPAGNYSDAQTVQLLSENDATIYYTTDGSTPTTSSPSVGSGGSVVVSSTETLHAFAVEPGRGNSSVSSAEYFFQVAPPAFSPSSTLLPGPTAIAINTATPSVTIHYSLTSSNPNASSPVYTGPITINPPATISAIAFRTGFTSSNTTQAQYTSFKISSLVQDPQGNVQITWNSVTGRTYQVQYSGDLVNWQNLGSPITGAGSPITVSDPGATRATSQRFYRVQVSLP